MTSEAEAKRAEDKTVELPAPAHGCMPGAC